MRRLQNDLEKVLAELRDAEDEQVALAARIEGLRARRDALQRAILAARAATGDRSDLEIMTKARAIVAILETSSSPMTLGQIAHALAAAGKPTTTNGVSVYINDLLNKGAVMRVERGLYVAAQ